jgi:hypothetical protein
VADLNQAAAWHRQVAALATAADRLGVAAADLPTVRSRLHTQQIRLNEAAARAGAPLPPLVPTPAEVAAATPVFGDFSVPVVARAVQTMLATLDAADAVLVPAPVPAVVAAPTAATAPPLGAPAPSPEATGRRWPVGVRNGLVYAAFAFLVMVMQIGLFIVIDEQALPFYAPLCLLVLPLFAWAAGWFTIGLAFPTPPGTPGPPRSWRLGLVVSMLPNILLCAWVGVLAIGGIGP